MECPFNIHKLPINSTLIQNSVIFSAGWFVLPLRYDFVGHQETLQQDAEQLLKMLKLEDDIKFPPSYENMTSPASMLDWFSTVPLEARRKLYELYEMDFRLFGYRKPSELLDG